MDIKMSKDIKDYEPKIFLSMTKDQAVSAVIAAGVGLLLFAALPFGTVINMILAVAAAAPPILFGWTKQYGMPFGRFFIRYMLPMLKTGRPRRYRTKNTLAFLAPKREIPNKVKRSKKIKGYK